MPHGNRQPSGRPPVLDDSEAQPTRDIVWSDDFDPHDNAASRRYWLDRCSEQLITIQMLQADLSAARFQRDGFWPLAFVVGVVVGIGLAVLW